MVADVGGTNTRLALFDPGLGQFRCVARFNNRDHSSLEAIIAEWLDSLTEPTPGEACIAVAAPPATEEITMINIGWSFSCSGLAARFGFARLQCLNDFQANAHALPHLGADDLAPIHGSPQADADGLCTIGPGTGLGGATLRRIDGRLAAFAAEPGHMGLSPASKLELAIFERLLPHYGNIYAELLLSGSGLVLLYRTLAELDGATPQPLNPADVTQYGLAGTDAHCATSTAGVSARYWVQPAATLPWPMAAMADSTSPGALHREWCRIFATVTFCTGSKARGQWKRICRRCRCLSSPPRIQD